MPRTAIVTGGGTGIGRAIARRLAADGLDVVITGRRKQVLEETAEELGVRAVAFDASDVAAIEAALPALPGRVDVLVNNAGGNIFRQRPTPAEGDLAGLRDLWAAQLEANLLSAVLVTSALTPRLSHGGRVISIGSIAGARGSGPGGSYGAAKAALHSWTGDLAFELGGQGITVNAIAPGYIEDTEFFGDDGPPAERRAALIGQAANGRPGRPEEIADTVAFLASTEAGNITAQVIHVNGGAFRGR
ncbi:SDR family NAD(P)-dependent oxidoreductase [Actinoallomurus acaciae]|uniref:SDR family NAD(P)-dependent oxidoreductase n=1 Tax=Actinoallomurus acaciae TaxID=502577 RepID=A0ABV5Y9E1_9ACTN